ncbi:MAG: hypothetical protein ASARMPREDX12_007846 [Alectoria sarmentosa]|nr:MAG: hypothetical protein ASARMPREDX12_007846 [Alectoria sarmentosa]
MATLEGESDPDEPDPLDAETVFDTPMLIEGEERDPVLEADVGFDAPFWPLDTSEEAKLDAELRPDPTLDPPNTDVDHDAELPLTGEVDWLDAESDNDCSVLCPLALPVIDVEDEEGVEALETCDTNDAVVPAEADTLEPALLWQSTGTETGVASTAVIDVVVLMIKERPGNAG